MNPIETFILELEQSRVPGDVYNQYADGNSNNNIRRQNLSLYLAQMRTFEPKILLVGEAPGYQGCRMTGVPFTSESILLKGVSKFNLFGKENGYKKTVELDKICTEPTATIVWETLVRCKSLPLLWNAFPFHPYKPGKIFSNRAPTKEEVEIGKEYLQHLIRLFQIKKVVAVGNKAQEALCLLCLEHQKIRHPARGGKMKFVEVLRRILS